MPEIRFRKNNTTYHLEWCGSGTPCEERFAYMYNGKLYYVPAMSTQGTKVYGGEDSNGRRYYYDTSSPTIAFRKNGKTYYLNKSFITEPVYDIPEGTYTPSQFGQMLAQFVNSVRNCKNSFTITAYYPEGGVSASSVIPANSIISFVSHYGGRRKGYTFNGGDINSEKWASGKAGYITYDTYNSAPFHNWNKSRVYVSGIKFN